MTEDKKYTIDEVIKIATEIGTKIGSEIGIQTGMEYIRKEKEKRRTDRYDRRLRNTKLLLREYRKLLIHSKDAVYSNKKASAIDILDELDCFEYDEDLYIESIKKSKERTAVIIDHIKKMMSIFRYMSYKSRLPEEKRRYEIIYELYISWNEPTVDELSEKYSINKRTLYKDVDKAVETLTALVFGVDGLKVI